MLAWAGVIFYLSSRSHVAVTDDPLWDLLTRKTAHFLVFGVLAFLAAARCAGVRRHDRRRVRGRGRL
ncbi:MAG: hypothetical protein R3C32_06270 [Chloroflexota bacterium]